MCLSKYEEAILLLKKSLQYVWSTRDTEAEMHVYKKLGLCYYYLGDLKKSEYYTNRSLEFDFELDESPLKQLSQEILKIFLEKNYPQQFANAIGIGLLNKLSIPLENSLVHRELPDMEFEVSRVPSLYGSLDFDGELSLHESVALPQLAEAEQDRSPL